MKDPEIRGAYLKDLGLGLLFCVIGGGSYVVNKIREAKANHAAPVVPATQPTDTEAQDEFGYATQNDSTNETETND